MYKEGGYLEKQNLLEKIQKEPKTDYHVTMIMQEIWYVNPEDETIAQPAWKWYKSGNLKKAFRAKKYEHMIQSCCMGCIQKIRI